MVFQAFRWVESPGNECHVDKGQGPRTEPGACQNFQITRGDGPVKHPEKGRQPGDSWAGMGPLLDYAGETGTGDRGVAEAVCDHPVGARGLLERVGDGGAGGPPRAARAFPFIWEEEGSGEVAGGGGAEEAARSLLGLPERRLSIRAEKDEPRHGA